MRKILGLDIGTNSIGWAIVNSVIEEQGKKMWIELAGSRIIPMDAAVLGDFDKGNAKSQASERTSFRSARRLRERHLLRRERLHRVLNLLGFLPPHYVAGIDFGKHPGKLRDDMEPKLPWIKNENGKYEFLFRESFEEMLADFAEHQPELVAGGNKIPYDWTLYFLRKKALTKRISKEELAWILLNFNRKRGYNQLRGEEEEEHADKCVEYHALKVVAVEATDQKKGKDTWYNIHLENGWIYRRTSNILPDWEGKVKEFIVTTELEKDGSPKLDKYGEVKRSFRMPQENDWTLVKKRTEGEIDVSGKTLGCYMYDALLEDPKQKIRGKLVRTIERRFYKDELRRILEKQTEYHPELRDKELYKSCIETLYPKNESHKANIANRGFVYLLLDDILFYQRPLKTKKSLIDNCPFEENQYVVLETGEVKKAPVKCIAKSHPLFQEFRLWQFVSNLRIYQREKMVDGKLRTDINVTEEFLKMEEDYTALFDWLNNQETIDQKAFLKIPLFGLKKDAGNYRWNYVEDKSYPCNETRGAILNRLQKAGIGPEFLDGETEKSLWHILYSVDDRGELDKALRKFAARYGFDEKFVETFRKMPPFRKEYGAFSAKAIKKLLPLMRMGNHWDFSQLDEGSKERIGKIITGEYDEKISNRVREKALRLSDEKDFRGLPLWLASYVVYGRHSEAKEIAKWERVDDLDEYLKSFRQHSLRNPIVEQVVAETLRVVRDIWKQTGQIDEIHVELGREMKLPAKEREKRMKQMLENENANLRVKALLTEFKNPEYDIENVRPYSPSQQDLLRIYEDGAFSSVESVPEDINDILKKFDGRKQPSGAEIMRYKLWLEQRYRSPYTGEIIPLGKLFTTAYEIEHVIPQSRYFDDSFSNKVICESEVNKLKNNQLGYEFIKNHRGQKVTLSFGRTVTIFSEETYATFVKENYSRSPGKMKKLLMDEIPDKFIERQLNDTRYISSMVKGLLSNIVREKDENGAYEPEAISKNVLVCNGGVTDRLKKDWGMNDIWNEIVYPRFERLNGIFQNEQFGRWENRDGKRVFRTALPLELQKGFSKKRIDHRHHAMDAIVIACATRNHINYLNNESARKDAQISRTDLQPLLCEKRHTDDAGNYKWFVKKPWQTFTQDAGKVLSDIVVSFKQNLRVINKATNYYQCYGENGKKGFKKQEKGDSWAIRKPMHKATVLGRVNLRKIKEVRLSFALENPLMIVDKLLKKKVIQLLSYKYGKKQIESYFKENASLWKELNPAKVKVYYFTDNTSEPLVAVRKSLDTTFDVKKIEGSVTDSGIRKIMLNHLAAKGGDPELAFSPDGIDEMNRNLLSLNDGKFHQPIYMVRTCETRGNKFSVGVQGNKSTKYVEAEKGTNLFFAVYRSEEGKRIYETIPLNIVIEREKQGYQPIPELNEKGAKLLFGLSPNDLVYLPTEDELLNGILSEQADRNRIYKMVSSTSYQCFFVPYYIANAIVNTVELGANNKAERAWTNEMIKEICIPVKVDRLGNITKVKVE